MGFLSRLFQRAVMTTAENRYHLSQKTYEEGLEPALVKKLYARQELLGGGWTLYSVTGRPLSGGDIRDRDFRDTLRRGRVMVEARGLTLTTAYNWLAIHEEAPASYALTLVPGGASGAPPDGLDMEQAVRDYMQRRLGAAEGGRAVLQQVMPDADDPSYWRNWTDRLSGAPAP